VGFKAVQIGPLRSVVAIKGKHLRRILEGLNIKKILHVR